MFRFFEPSLKKSQNLIQGCLIGVKPSMDKLALRYTDPKWTKFICQAIDGLTMDELNLLKLRSSARPYPQLTIYIKKVINLKTPPPPLTQGELIQIETNRIEALQLALEAKQSELLSVNHKSKKIGSTTFDLSRVDVEISYMGKVEIILTCIGLMMGSFAFEYEDTLFLLGLTDKVMSKEEYKWYDRNHEEELCFLLKQFSLTVPIDQVTMTTAIAASLAVESDMESDLTSLQPKAIASSLKEVNSKRIDIATGTPHINEVVLGQIISLFEMTDIELLRFFQWSLNPN